ncbi:carbohydrate-binding family 9-like protein [Cohnella soli]|uniref:Carbohydrate-binding family 9-like protein n=1 Tax=Cohnella soli TaxID=425005 RepID=A0ABW0HRZ0_9BACL
MSINVKEYQCLHVQYHTEMWREIESVSLVEVVTGAEVKEPTTVRACWDDKALYVRFECKDTYWISNYTNRKDPLYEQDVVEMFIDAVGDCKKYIELVVSPSGVLCDLMIDHEDEMDPLSFTVDSDWEVEGFSQEIVTEGDKRIYTFKIPFSNFPQAAKEGTEWRINFFRIDEDRDGVREYQAWSPTGAVNYHIADRFGKLSFVK